MRFVIPAELREHAWKDELNTARPDPSLGQDTFQDDDLVPVMGHSVRLLKRRDRPVPAELNITEPTARRRKLKLYKYSR